MSIEDDEKRDQEARQSPRAQVRRRFARLRALKASLPRAQALASIIKPSFSLSSLAILKEASVRGVCRLRASAGRALSSRCAHATSERRAMSSASREQRN